MATEDADIGTHGDQPSLRPLLHAATGRAVPGQPRASPRPLLVPVSAQAREQGYAGGVTLGRGQVTPSFPCRLMPY
jgi:hypothetical protein